MRERDGLSESDYLHLIQHIPQVSLKFRIKCLSIFSSVKRISLLNAFASSKVLLKVKMLTHPCLYNFTLKQGLINKQTKKTYIYIYIYVCI